MRVGRRLGAIAGGLGAVAAVAAGAYSVAAVAEHAMKTEAAEDALYRCEPVSTDPAPLTAMFPYLDAVTAATWCAKPPGDPEYGRISAPDPDDLVYYAVVRTTDIARVEASLPGPWLPGADLASAGIPAALTAALPSSDTWVRSTGSPAFIDRASGTVVLYAAEPPDPAFPAPLSPTSPTPPATTPDTPTNPGSGTPSTRPPTP